MAIQGGPKEPKVVRFGDFQLDRQRRTLLLRDVRLKLQPQPFAVLERLVQAAPAVVSREDLHRHVWGDAVNVDVEQSLNYCIRQIRIALGDGSAEPRYIETVPRQGYRFIAAVSRDGDPPEAPEVPASPPASDGYRRWLMPGGAVVGLAILMAMGAHFLAGRKGESRGPAKVSFVTTYPGDEVDPSLSPDGSQVAFSWDGIRQDNRDIYVLPVGGQSPLRLTQDPGEDVSPTWSPDGRSIAFIRRSKGGDASILLIPALGGAERTLYAIRLGSPVTEIDQRKLAWSPDGKWLVFANQAQSGDHGLFLFSLETGRAHAIFPHRPSGFDDMSPAFSPDGRRLAFARFHSPSTSDLLIQQMRADMEPEGEPVPVPNTGPNPHSPAWREGSGELLFLDGPDIKRFGSGGSTETVYSGDSQLQGLTWNGFRAISARSPNNTDIFTIPLRHGGLSAEGPPEPLIRSTAPDLQPRFSPDGKSLAFVSYRSGAGELWLANADGSNEKQLTNLGAHILGFPRWSPDGRQIAFHARIPNESQIYVLNVAAGIPRQVTTGMSGSSAPSWSDDGKTLYISKLMPGQWLLYKVPSAGGKEERLVSGEGAFPVVAPGRGLLLYCKLNKFGIFSRAVEGNSTSDIEERLVDDYAPPFGGFYPVEDGIYYTSFTPAGIARNFRFYSFALKKSMDIAPAPATIKLGLSVSPDRRRLAYCADVEGNKDLILLELK